MSATRTVHTYKQHTRGPKYITHKDTVQDADPDNPQVSHNVNAKHKQEKKKSFILKAHMQVVSEGYMMTTSPSTMFGLIQCIFTQHAKKNTSIPTPSMRRNDCREEEKETKKIDY